MSARTMPGTRPRNGLPPGGGYVYNGTGRDEEEAEAARRAARGRRRSLPERVLAVLREHGELSTPEIRTALELDGGPAFHPDYLPQALSVLARRDPPAVTRAGREKNGSGRPVRWKLGPGGGEGS